ncbi:hypothetical protein MASR2M70_12280 [Bacillota bacterium]
MSDNRKTALVLGGGGARGAYEIGVWQALRELGIKIDIITGCSVGAINGAVIAQNSYDMALKLWGQIRTDMVVDGALSKRKSSPLKDFLSRHLDENLVRSSGVDFGLVTVELPALTPRYFYLDDIPRGKLVDFIVASSSLFPAIRVADIDNIKYVDGGYLDNVPAGMALKRGATHIIAVDLETAGIVQKEPLKRAENLILIRCKWGLGDVMVFDGNNVEKNIRLGYLDTLKAFDFFDGHYYAFSKGELNKKRIAGAEAAGRIFEMDPLLLYTADSFNRRIESAIGTYLKASEAEQNSFQSRLKEHKSSKEPLIAILKKSNQKLITIMIADQLKSKPEMAYSLLAKPVALLFKDESKAAAYLVKEKLI